MYYSTSLIYVYLKPLYKLTKAFWAIEEHIPTFSYYIELATQQVSEPKKKIKRFNNRTGIGNELAQKPAHRKQLWEILSQLDGNSLSNMMEILTKLDGNSNKT